MDGQTKCHRNGKRRWVQNEKTDKVPKQIEMPLKWTQFNKLFFTGTTMCYYIWSISVAFPYFLHFYVHPFHRHLLFPFLWHLVCPSISYRLPLYPKSLELESWNFDTMFTTPCVWRVTCHVSHIAIHILAVTCPDLEKKHFLWTLKFGEYRFGGKGE